MKFSELGNSRFLKQDDIGEGLTLTINGVSQENLAQENERPDMAACFSFADHEKMFVVKPANGGIIMDQLGLGDDDDLDVCVGCRVSFYVDPSIMFGKKRVGGIRVKQILRPGSVQRTTPQPQQQTGNGAEPNPQKAEAWKNFCVKSGALDRDGRIRAFTEAMGQYFGEGVEPSQVTPAQWQSFGNEIKSSWDIVNGFPMTKRHRLPAENPLSETPEFAVDDIPF